MRLLLDTTASAKRHRMALLPSLRELQYIGVSLDSIYRYYRYNRSRSSPLIACSDIAASDDHSASLPRSEVVEGEYFSASPQCQCWAYCVRLSPLCSIRNRQSPRAGRTRGC